MRLMKVLIMMGFFLPSSSLAQDYVKLGQIGFAQWRCAAWAAISKEEPPSIEKLFDNGYEKMKVLVTDIIAQKVPESALKELPIGITWVLTGGPSIDFRLGAMWANLYDYEYDVLLPADDGKTSLSDRFMLQRLRAGNKFRDGNCSLL